MPYQTGDRNQIQMLPPTIDEMVADNDPVRAYDAIIDKLDLSKLGLQKIYKKAGKPPYDPLSMLKLLVYGYSYGWRSSRKLERATYHNLSFIWLLGGLKPDHKTIANFRKKNKKVLKKVLKQCARLCLKLDLIQGNCLFADGTKIRGSASKSKTYSKQSLESKLVKVEQRIDDLLKECDRIDSLESGSFVKMGKELNSQEKLKSKIETCLNELETSDRKEINLTDPDCIVFKSRQGIHAGMNAQIVVDEKNGLIVNSDVVSEANDRNQLSGQIEQANHQLKEPCRSAVADAGYSSVGDLKKLVDQGIDVIVPSQKQAEKNPTVDPFSKDRFRYDRDNNEYICPMGQRLVYSYFSTVKRHYVYRFTSAKICQQCEHFGICTKAKRGRSIQRLEFEEIKEDLESRYDSEEGQTKYQKRKALVEHPFGHIKRNLTFGSFLMRGIEAAKGEFAIASCCFNIARMITLFGGVTPLMKRLETV